MKSLLFFIFVLFLSGINLSAGGGASTPSPDKADTLYREWSSSRGATKTEIANRLMKTFFDEKDMDTLMVFSKQSQARQNASVMTYMTNHLFYQSRFDEAYQLGVDALLKSENIGEVSLISECLNTLGIICQRKGLFEQALSYMKRVYALDKQWGSPADMSTTMNNLATLYLGVDDPETALSYVLPSIAYERESGDGARLAIRLGLASDIWLSLGHPEKALEFIDEALGIDLREGRNVKAAVRRSQRASVLSALGRYKDARACLDSAVTVLEQEANHISLAICYNLRGVLDIKEKHFADAVTAYSMAKTVAEKNGGDYVKLKSLRGLSDAYGKSGNYAAALDWLNEYVALSDRLAKDRSRLAVEDFKVQYHTAEKENELEIHKIESHNRLLLVVLLSLLALILLICMGVVLSMLYMKKRQEEILRRNDEAKSRLLSLVPAMKDRKKAEFISEVVEEIEGLNSDKETGVAKLTNREMEIVRLCCEGLSSKEIAAQMELSVRTVDTHKANIFRKLKIKSTVELVKYVAETGLLG